MQNKREMSDNSTAQNIASIVATVIGGLASAYLTKKLIDSLDNNKKVLRPFHVVLFLGGGCCEKDILLLATEVRSSHGKEVVY